MANKLVVSDQEQAADYDYIVCVRASEPAKFDDDVFDVCCRCDEQVRMRPHNPKGPKIICVPCAMSEMKEQAKKGELELTVTSTTAAEFNKFKSAN